MQHLWSADELMANWSLAPGDMALLAGLTGAGRLGLAVQLAFVADTLDEYSWTDRTGRRHRRMVFDHLAITTFDDNAGALFRRWLADEVLPRELQLNALLSDDGEGAAFTRLTADPGRVGLESLLAEIAKLDRLRTGSRPVAWSASGPDQPLSPASRDRNCVGVASAPRAHPPAAVGFLLCAA